MWSLEIERVSESTIADSSTICLPLAPVNAFALPALQSSAPPKPYWRFSLHQSTGADGQSDFVKTPATRVSSSMVIRHRSSLFSYRMPLCAVAMLIPGTFGISGKSLGASGEIDMVYG